jgi:hypothetical protein
VFDGAEFRAAEHGIFPLDHLDLKHAAAAHAVLRTEATIAAA